MVRTRVELSALDHHPTQSHAGSWWDISSTTARKVRYGLVWAGGWNEGHVLTVGEGVSVVLGGCPTVLWRQYHPPCVPMHTLCLVCWAHTRYWKANRRRKKKNLKKSQPNTRAQADLGTCRIPGKSHQVWIFLDFSDLEQSNRVIFLSCHYLGLAVELSCLDIPKRLPSFCLARDRWRSGNTSLRGFESGYKLSFFSCPHSTLLSVQLCSVLPYSCHL